ncbi:acetate kinase [Pasteurella multocida]|uniref:Acetate kinase n=1 Tax=Pasteurella multocida (strain Pm70) TaxID=272843 RepID=ACKA_PASMU|nr:acetate kinase [Pasteurella multocida]P57866.1 RecName: Full=Acetate kinase; AltName: Full=Acetokinase [Pasteurella multocida subsp. multocida str. Pm70]AAK02788.1 AckA [Pasteurella multocida subsp. multocida str. Pm70]APW55308.1 acetate kinase [Pasteurella multocida subsp. multocida str. HN07]ARA69142.1 acetate kinase [Pasteurella multocida subsp. multocida]ARA89041.1 acetate kinase [Pasteurella multocida subsp. septica]AUL53341.1 acetate kinase [Pasteurella multocida]
MSQKLVLILNCGSSSLKFSILDPQTGEEKLSGLAEAFHLDDARIKWKLHGEKGNADLGAGAAHSEALNFIVNSIFPLDPSLKEDIVAIGHRIVHGGEKFTSSVVITDEVVQGIKDAVQFAPLHNPAHLIGIEEAFKMFPHLKDKNVAVFDTAFHQTMPEEAYLYALPYSLYREHGVRRYGAHGTSHFFVSQQAAERLNVPAEQVNVITCHLGNGASIAAVRHGQCIDTSMGLTPLEGLVMGTRSGDIDPAIVFYLHDNLGLSVEEINTLLTKKSGLLGLTEVTSDCRYAEDNYDKEASAKRALDVFSYRLAKYIGSYMAVIGERLDAIVFTGGIGENSSLVRELTLNHLKLFGYQVDSDKNKAARFGHEGVITADNTPVAMVIPTNEELVIAQDTARLCIA